MHLVAVRWFRVGINCTSLRGPWLDPASWALQRREIFHAELFKIELNALCPKLIVRRLMSSVISPVISIPRNWRAAPKFVVLYLSASFALMFLTTAAALLG